jgi:hypothetical protein
MPHETVFIGVDITSGSRPVSYAVLDDRLHIEKLDEATLEEVVDIILGYPATVCAVNAPSGSNKSLLAEPDYRQRVGLAPDGDNYSTYRVCEYEIRRRGIGIYNTPSDADEASDWMKVGWQLYARLHKEGFVDYPRPGPRRLLEVHPHSAYATLIGRRPYRKTSLEGRLQRQLVLYDNGIDVPDAMHILPELTRHRLLTGQLDIDIRSPDELDALVATYTAFLVEREPHNTAAVGDTSEGVIILPISPGALQDSYA